MDVHPNYYLKNLWLYKIFFFFPQILKKNCLLNVRMITLSLNELKLIAQYRNISDYENKSKEDLIKHLANQNQN